MSIATAPIAGFGEPTTDQIGRGQALWTVIKRKPLGMASAALILQRRFVPPAFVMDVRTTRMKPAARRNLSRARYFSSERNAMARPRRIGHGHGRQ